MKNLVQIICGAGGAETIEECARVPEMLGATVIVVYALWPQYDYPNGDANFALTKDLVAPDFNLDDVESVAKRKGWHYIRLNEFAFNGRQYNIALDYIKQNNIPCDHIWFVDSDECLDPIYVETLQRQIEECKSNQLEQLRFSSNYEILPEWRFIKIDNRIGGNYGILWGDALNVLREEYFDGNFQFKSPVRFGASGIPLYHLHHFRKNAASRIYNGIWKGGGLEIDTRNAEKLPRTPYVDLLESIFANNFKINETSPSSYLGNSIFRDKEG